MKKRIKGNPYIFLYLCLSAILVLLMIYSFYVGRYSEIKTFDVLKILLSKLFPFISRGWNDTAEAVVINLRLPRIVASVIIGASLAISGASYQCLFGNPIASSDTLGGKCKCIIWCSVGSIVKCK